MRQVFRPPLLPPEPEPAWRRDVWTTHIEAIVGGRHVLYDCHDATAVRRPLPEGTEICFKRAYVEDLEPLPIPVAPLGLIFDVTTSGFDRFELARVLRLDGGRRALLGALGVAG